MNIKTIVLILSIIILSGGYFTYDNYQNNLKIKEELQLEQKIEDQRLQQREADKERLEQKAKLKEERKRKELESLKLEQEINQKKELEIISTFIEENKNNISIISVSKNERIQFTNYFAKKIMDIRKGTISLDRIANKNNNDLTVYLQSNLQNSPKQDQVKRIINQINKKHKRGNFIISEDDFGNLIYFYNNNEVSVKSDRLIKAEKIYSSETTELTDKEREDINSDINKLQKTIYEEHYNKNNLIIYASKTINIKQDEVKNIIQRFKKTLANREVFISRDNKGDIEIIINNYKKSVINDTNNNFTKKPLIKVRKSTHIYYFDFDKTNVINKEYLDNYLDNLKIAIEELGVKKLIIVGHTDSMGPKSYNRYLSYKRANALNKYFSKFNIDIDIEYRPKGESVPAASNETEEGRSKNRRIEMYFGWEE